MTVKTAALSTQDTADWKMSMKNFCKNITAPIRIVVSIVFTNKKVPFSANSDNVLQILLPVQISMIERKFQKALWMYSNYKWSNQLYYFAHMFEFTFYQIRNFSMICYQKCPTL